jgi:hypothetical protein
MDSNDRLLKGYAPRRETEWIFWPILMLMVGTFLGSGLYLKTIRTITAIHFKPQTGPVSAQFIMNEQKEPSRKVQKKKETVNEKGSEEPVDLTKKPLLGQKQDDITPAAGAVSEAPARRVYGLRRVFSTGFGATGGGSDAVIGKLGNTLNTDIDTIIPSKDDLKGEVVSITTITEAPRLKVSIKPEYTREMIDNKVKGVVRAKLLVDIDGKVKKVILYNDLGFGSREKLIEAFSKLEFEPAMAGSEPRAVWIPFTFRFELLNG